MKRFEPLTPELERLHQELSRIHIEERASFGPELEAELRRARPLPPVDTRLRSLPRPWAVAASLAALTAAALAAPPARAAIIDGIRGLLGGAVATEPAGPEETAALAPLVVLPPAEAPDGGVGFEELTSQAPTGSEGGSPVGARRATGSSGPGFSVYPSLLDTRAAQDLVRRHYPPELLATGVGGVVHLLLWVRPDGTVDQVQVAESSGRPALDRAALEAAPGLRFSPAARDGVPVGTWVEFDLVFQALDFGVDETGPGAGGDGR